MNWRKDWRKVFCTLLIVTAEAQRVYDATRPRTRKPGPGFAGQDESSLEPLRIDEPRGGDDGLRELLTPPMPKPGCWRMECTTEGSRSCNFFESGKWIDGACRDVDVVPSSKPTFTVGFLNRVTEALTSFSFEDIGSLASQLEGAAPAAKALAENLILWIQDPFQAKTIKAEKEAKKAVERVSDDETAAEKVIQEDVSKFLPPGFKVPEESDEQSLSINKIFPRIKPTEATKLKLKTDIPPSLLPPDYPTGLLSSSVKEDLPPSLLPPSSPLLLSPPPLLREQPPALLASPPPPDPKNPILPSPWPIAARSARRGAGRRARRCAPASRRRAACTSTTAAAFRRAACSTPCGAAVCAHRAVRGKVPAAHALGPVHAAVRQRLPGGAAVRAGDPRRR